MISIAYITARLDPRLDLFFDSISPQLKQGDEVILIDHWLDYYPNRKTEVETLLNGRFDLIHLPPKPSIWRGIHRKTKRDFADTSAARNTAIIVATKPYIVFLDDLSAVHHNWREYHEIAAKDGKILAGQFKTVRDLKVLPNGEVDHRICGDQDVRVYHQPDNNPIPITGGWVFGSNSGLPVEYLNKIGGYDEFCARRGIEDCNLGVRLEIAGYKDKMWYDKNCVVYEDKYYHYSMSNSTWNPMLAEYIPLRRYKTDDNQDREQGPKIFKAMEDVELKHLHETKSFLPLNPYFNLEKERELYQKTGTFRSVENDTYIDYDGQPIEEL